MTPTQASIELLLLPLDGDAAALPITADRDGRVLQPARGTPSPTAGVRRILAVPGADCLVLWLELPARSPAQALAAARLLVAEHLAATPETQHIVVGPAIPGSDRRPVVCVDRLRMRDWLARAASIGFEPDTVVPAPLLLPLPQDAEAVTIAEHDGEWLVRGANRAFAAEPALARHVLGEQPHEMLAEPLAALAGGALTPPIDLLQHDFARTPVRREGWPAWHRAAALAALVAVSPLLVSGAGAARDHFAANRLDSRAQAAAASVLPALPALADPVAMVRARHAELLAGDTFNRTTAALFKAIEAVDSAELDALSFDGDTVAAEIAHAGAGDLEALRTRLAEAGLTFKETGSRAAGNRTHSTIEMELAP